MNLENLIRNLRNKKLRVTKLRRAILGILLKDNTPISVTEIDDSLLKIGIRSHKTSIYREFAVLKKNRFVREIQFGENKKRYELETGNHHHHIICVDCDKIEDVFLEKHLDSHEQKITKQKNFKIISHSLEFFGLCSKCSR